MRVTWRRLTQAAHESQWSKWTCRQLTPLHFVRGFGNNLRRRLRSAGQVIPAAGRVLVGAAAAEDHVQYPGVCLADRLDAAREARPTGADAVFGQAAACEKQVDDIIAAGIVAGGGRLDA